MEASFLFFLSLIFGFFFFDVFFFFFFDFSMFPLFFPPFLFIFSCFWFFFRFLSFFKVLDTRAGQRQRELRSVATPTDQPKFSIL